MLMKGNKKENLEYDVMRITSSLLLLLFTETNTANDSSKNIGVESTMVGLLHHHSVTAVAAHWVGCVV